LSAPRPQAQVELGDSTKRKNLDETLKDARMLVLREIGLPRDAPDDHELLRPPKMRDPDLKERVKRKAKEIIIDDELRKRRCVVRSRPSAVFLRGSLDDAGAGIDEAAS